MTSALFATGERLKLEIERIPTGRRKTKQIAELVSRVPILQVPLPRWMVIWEGREISGLVLRDQGLSFQEEDIHDQDGKTISREP
jgi:hypothetical protein